MSNMADMGNAHICQWVGNMSMSAHQKVKHRTEKLRKNTEIMSKCKQAQTCECSNTPMCQCRNVAMSTCGE